MSASSKDTILDLASLSTSRPRLSERIAIRVSPLTLAVALLVFVVPFASVSCATPSGYGSMGGGVTARYSGLDLALGGLPTLEAAQNVPPPGPPTEDDAVPPQPLFAIALVLTAAAFFTSVWPRRSRPLAILVLAAGAVATAVIGLAEFDRWLTDRIVAALARQANPRLASTDPATYVSGDIGLVVFVLCLALTSAVNGLAILRGRADTRAP